MTLLYKMKAQEQTMCTFALLTFTSQIIRNTTSLLIVNLNNWIRVSSIVLCFYHLDKHLIGFADTETDSKLLIFTEFFKSTDITELLVNSTDISNLANNDTYCYS